MVSVERSLEPQESICESGKNVTSQGDAFGPRVCLKCFQVSGNDLEMPLQKPSVECDVTGDTSKILFGEVKWHRAGSQGHLAPSQGLLLLPVYLHTHPGLPMTSNSD